MTIDLDRLEALESVLERIPLEANPAPLITAMRNALPDLIAELRELRGIAEAARDIEEPRIPPEYPDGDWRCHVCGRGTGHYEDCAWAKLRARLAAYDANKEGSK